MNVTITSVATGKPVALLTGQAVTEKPNWFVVRPEDPNSLAIRVLHKAHFKVEAY